MASDWIEGALIFLMALLFGLVATSLAVAKEFVEWPHAILLGFLATFLYPLLGFGATLVCQGLRFAAFPRARPWKRDDRMIHAAVWPISLLFWLVVGPFYVLLNVLFGD